jgi:hypothetical protein
MVLKDISTLDYYVEHYKAHIVYTTQAFSHITRGSHCQDPASRAIVSNNGEHVTLAVSSNNFMYTYNETSNRRERGDNDDLPNEEKKKRKNNPISKACLDCYSAPPIRCFIFRL